MTRIRWLSLLVCVGAAWGGHAGMLGPPISSCTWRYARSISKAQAKRLAEFFQVPIGCLMLVVNEKPTEDGGIVAAGWGSGTTATRCWPATRKACGTRSFCSPHLLQNPEFL